MRIVLAIVVMLAVAGCQRSGREPYAMPAAAPAPSASIATSPALAVGSGVPVPPQKGASVIATAIAKTKPGAKSNEVRDQAGHDRNDPCDGLVDDKALDDCLAREDAGAPDRAADNRGETTVDHPEIDPHDRDLMNADEANVAGRRDDGDDSGPLDPSDEPPPEDNYPPSDDPPPDDYPPDDNPDEPPPPYPYQR